MKRIPSYHPYYAHRSGSTFGKVVATIASLLTIAAILFIGSREWKSDKPITASLFEISDIKALFTKVEQSGSSSAQMKAALDQSHNDVERALIEKGTLVRRSTQLNNQDAPVGLSRGITSH